MFVKREITPVTAEKKCAMMDRQHCCRPMRKIVLKLRSQWRRNVKKLRRNQTRFGYDLESYFQNFDDGLQDHCAPVPFS